MAQKTNKRKSSKLRNFFYNNKKLKTGRVLVSLVVFASFGVYLTNFILAAPRYGVPRDNPARGLSYKGLKKAKKGPCTGGFVLISDNEASPNVPCSHPEPGPEGVDVRERIKYIDSELSDMMARDRKRPSLKSNAPASDDPTNTKSVTANVAVSGSNMNSVIPRNWPCVGNGFDGNRVKLFYAYPSGSGNYLPTYRPILEALAKRMNAIMYNSAVASGDSNGMQIRFGTNNACVLTIQAVAISGDITDFNNINAKMKAAGLVKPAWKDLIWVDAVPKSYVCGNGQSYNDDSPGQSNYNNSGNMIAAVWRNCWNYGEPHELMHMLGAVRSSAPHATNGLHCYDKYDIMCYDDDGPGGFTMKLICPTASAVWRYDCNFDDYFDAASPKGYLATHWNTAKNKFLIP